MKPIDIVFRARKSENYRYCNSWKSEIYRDRDLEKKQQRNKEINTSNNGKIDNLIEKKICKFLG